MSAEQAKPFWYEGNFAPVLKEVTEHKLEVTGNIPPELNGRYFRNGANPMNGSSDWFLGEGMLHGVEIQNGVANWYKNRFVQTPLLKEKKITREHTTIPGNSLANTHVIKHAGKYLALQEMHGPIEMTKDLDTVGPYNFDNKLARNMTAHPKICPETGEMMFFGYGVFPPFLTYHRVSASGELVQSEEIDVKGATMAHDFVITRNFVIFMDLPMVWDTSKFLEKGIAVNFDENYGARMGIMPRAGSNKDVKWYDIDPCYVFHTMNAYEDGTKIVINAPRLKGYTSVGMKSPPIPKLHKWVLDMQTGKVSESQLDDIGVDFPQVSPNLVGLPFRYGYMAEFNTKGAPYILGYHKYDMHTGSKTSYTLEEGQTGSEASFIPAMDGTSEDDGYLMSYVHNARTDKSDLVIMSTSEFETGPIARIHLPVRVPAGFHGSWMPDAA